MRFYKLFVFTFIAFSSLFSISPVQKTSSNNLDSYFNKVDSATNYLSNRIHSSPKLLIVLTAGVRGPIDEMEDIIEIDSKNIPHFPKAKVQGHEGKLIFGKLDGNEIVLLKGRYHFYEGISAQDVVFPYFVLNQLGVESVITMNAVGGINENFKAGDIMLVNDHINYLWDNPLKGLTIQFPEKQFTPMNDAYSMQYQHLARNIASSLNFELKEGVYLATIGPNYETKSEVKLFRSFGADAVGMSTVFEVLACNFLNMKVLAFCCIANQAADLHDGTISHEEVLESLTQMGPKMTILTTQCAKQILKSSASL